MQRSGENAVVRNRPRHGIGPQPHQRRKDTGPPPVRESRSAVRTRTMSIIPRLCRGTQVPALILGLTGLLIGARAQAQFKCPELKGFFPDPEQCDLYYACVDGQAEEKLCKDGLVFRDENPKKELCDIPANVPCGDRTLLQEPQPSKGCPRANGYFKHEDPASCDRFVNCIDGDATVMPCPPGLVYEEKMSSCVWAADATTLCEDVKLDTLDDGFSCPRTEVIGPGGRVLPHPTFPHPEDCAKFYICRNGMVPQKGQCESGTVYNEESFRCTEPELVQGCEDYYKNQNF